MAYMPETRLCNDSFIEIGKASGRSLVFFSLAFSFIFLHFLIGQTPSKDDNLEDEWLELLSP